MVKNTLFLTRKSKSILSFVFCLTRFVMDADLCNELEVQAVVSNVIFFESNKFHYAARPCDERSNTAACMVTCIPIGLACVTIYSVIKAKTNPRTPSFCQVTSLIVSRRLLWFTVIKDSTNLRDVYLTYTVY